MDNQSEKSCREFANITRVSAKIIEYCKKIAPDRDLGKFMRLDSPASTQGSQETHSADTLCVLDVYCKETEKNRLSTNSSGNLNVMPSRLLGICGVTNSKSLPNIDLHDQSPNLKSYAKKDDVITDKNIEADPHKEKILSLSTKYLKTPKKSFKNTETQTPESVAKTHRRLEWDSLGDVGYKKSMSASNVNTIERSLLKEFFKENDFASEPETSTSNREEQTKCEESRAARTLNVSQCGIGHNTPPLASSTLYFKSDRGAKPKMLSHSTSPQEKFEKYAQTSLIKPATVRSQEVQCTMSSSNSNMEGTATPSSFEYYSTKSSRSESSHSAEFVVNANNKKQLKTHNNPFITSITDLLMKRKALSERNQEKRHQFNNIRELQTKLQAALDENKENHSQSTVDSMTTTSFSLSKQAPELDLGIQLICALVDAKSVNGKQKKQLIRDIIKRITNLGTEDQTTINSSSQATSTNSSNNNNQHIYNSVRSNIRKKTNQRIIGVFTTTSELDVSPIQGQSVSTQQENCSVKSIHTFTKDLKHHVMFPKSCHFPQHQCKGNSVQFPYKKNLRDDTHKENHTKVSSLAAAAISKETQSEFMTVERSKDKHKKTATDSNVLKENKTNRFTQTSKTPSTSTSIVTTPDLTTQKKYLTTKKKELNDSNMDAEQPTMREWLNPLTQSEIEYEEKKRVEENEMKKKTAALQAEKLRRKSKHDCDRVQQINWIETEINRLECLKHLLLKDESSPNSSTGLSSLQNSSKKHSGKVYSQTDKLYDTVHSDKSSSSNASRSSLVQEIEIVLEESHEDVVNLRDNVKSTKDRRKETQIMYEKDEDPVNGNINKIKPKLRTVSENINIREQHFLNDKQREETSNQRVERGKIDTPSTDNSQGSESLRDLVEQRKREFMETYNSKKQQLYEALKQQQHQQKQQFKKDFKYLNAQNEQIKKSTTTTDSQHYSLPQTLPSKYVSNDVSYYTQHPLPITLPERAPKRKSLKSVSAHVTYNTTAANEQPSVKSSSQEIVNAAPTSTSNTITTSSSSMFCMSSDVSVPMGSQNTSSTETTTHQYDDVATAAAAVAVSVQTSDSMLRSKPIYGPTSVPYTHIASTNTASIQVKPKGIAYIIEFDENEHATSSVPASESSINTNKRREKSNASDTNDLKTVLSTEPQLTLQEHLERGRPKFLQHSRERRAILIRLHSMRQERDRQLREIVDNTSFNSLEKHLQHLPPPPTQQVRILNTREMKALTNKRFTSLPEVVAKHEREVEERKRRGNRILRDVFNKRLQKRVRSGKLSLNHSKTVI